MELKLGVARKEGLSKLGRSEIPCELSGLRKRQIPGASKLVEGMGLIVGFFSKGDKTRDARGKSNGVVSGRRNWTSI